MAATPSAKNYVGFKFDPTDEELVVFYLKRKTCGKKLPKGVIPELDIYKFEPWELADQSTVETEDDQLFFFCKFDQMQPTDGASSMCTKAGFWKVTEKSDLVKYDSRIVGVRRTLVFHVGCASQARHTNWVMDEYRLCKEELSKLTAIKGQYVVCKVYQMPNAEVLPDYCDAPFTAEDGRAITEPNDFQEKKHQWLNKNPKAVVLPTDGENGDATGLCDSGLTDGLERELHNLSLDHVALAPERRAEFEAEAQHVTRASSVNGTSTKHESGAKQGKNAADKKLQNRTCLVVP